MKKITNKIIRKDIIHTMYSDGTMKIDFLIQHKLKRTINFSSNEVKALQDLYNGVTKQ